MIISRLFKKTLLVVLGIFLVIGILSSAFSAWVLREQLVDDYVSRAESMVGTISVSVPTIFLKREAASIQSIIDQYLEEKGVGYVYVLDDEKEIIAHTFTPTVPPDIRKTVTETSYQRIVQKRVYLNGQEYIDVGGPVLLGEGGYVHIGMKMQTINNIILKNLLTIQAFNIFLFLLSVGFLYAFMDKISRPLMQLTDYARKLAQKDFSAKVDIQSRDEMGELAHSMQHMGRELAGFVGKLQKAVNNATQELQETLAYLHAILDNLADGLVVTDEDRNIVRYNLAFKSIFEIREKNLVDSGLGEFVPEELTGKLSDDPFEEIQRIDFVFKDREGRKRFIEATVTFVSLTCGLNHIFIFHDITKRKDTENELRSLYAELDQRVIERTRELERTNELLQSEVELRKQAEEQLLSEKELFSVTLKSIGDGVVTTDWSGNVVFVNATAERFLGVSMGDAQELPFSRVCRLVDGNSAQVNPVQDVLAEGGIFERKRGIYLKTEMPGGSDYMNVSFKTTPIYDQQSLILGTVTVFQDISDILRMEEERLRKEKLESIGILAGGIAHDFNNLLTSILNHIQMVKMNTDPESREFSRLNDAQNAVLRSKQLTQQLLTFSKGGAPIRETISVPELLEETINFALRGSNVRSDIQTDKNLWPANVDSGQIAQVFENLTLNAVQAMPEGGNIYVRASNYPYKGGNEDLELSSGNYIRIDFWDDGPGIPEEYQEKIFDPYFSTKEVGSGLGLASTYSIIKNHMGEIAVASASGRGAYFIVYLPAVDATHRVDDCRSGAGRLRFGQGRILVMDDVQDILDVMRDALELLGYEGDFTSCGEEALRKYKEAHAAGNPYDAVILDLTVPGGMGGKDTVGEILKVDPQARILVSSGYSQDPIMGNFRRYGFCGVLAKPYTVEDVGRVLDEALNRS